MLELTNKTVHTYDDGKLVETSFDVEGTVVLAGDSLWGDTADRAVRVEGITITEDTSYDDEAYISVGVAHDSTWDIYTDTAFEAAISAALGMRVTFTEQGMQEDGLASMEV